MQHRRAVILQQRLGLAEKLLVVDNSHMLEHADRDDTVELFIQVAIVKQAEICAI